MCNASLKPEKQVSPAKNFCRGHISQGNICDRNLNATYRWSRQRANEWFEKRGWIVAVTYIQSTAEKQLDMWQEATFDACVIEEELAWLADSGYNTIRVYLHHLAWEKDPKGYLSRIDWFLNIADVHGINTILVLFDGHAICKPEGQPVPPGPDPNSGWPPCPAGHPINERCQYDALNSYVQGIVRFFKQDPRVLLWDLLSFNDPVNTNPASGRINSCSKHQAELALPLLQKAIKWVRIIDPIQPITMTALSGNNLKTPSVLDSFIFNHADIISCHGDKSKNEQRKRIRALLVFGRPIICTEHMANNR